MRQSEKKYVVDFCSPVRSWLFLILSGLATGASWLCYFYAIKVGDVSKVVPIDKCSLVLTIVFAIIVNMIFYYSGCGNSRFIAKEIATAPSAWPVINTAL